MKHMRAARALLFFLVLSAAVTARSQRDSSYTGPFAIAGIVLEGNRATKERVILRELTVREGDTARTSEQLYYLLERSRQNVYNTGLFNSVHIVPTYLSAHDVFLTVTVSERWFYWPTPIFKYSDPNFNTWWLTRDFRRVYYGAFLYRYNMRGRNETLYAKVQLGYAKEFAMRYRFPFIDRKQRWGLAGAASIPASQSAKPRADGGHHDRQAKAVAGRITDPAVRVLCDPRDGDRDRRRSADQPGWKLQGCGGQRRRASGFRARTAPQRRGACGVHPRVPRPRGARGRRLAESFDVLSGARRGQVAPLRQA